MGEVNRAVETAGFQIIEGMDRAVEENGPTTPWYRAIETQQRRLATGLPLGRKALFGASRLAEVFGVFPKGSTGVVRLLEANAIVAGGRAGIFSTVSWLVNLFDKPRRRGFSDDQTCLLGCSVSMIVAGVHLPLVKGSAPGHAWASTCAYLGWRPISLHFSHRKVRSTVCSGGDSNLGRRTDRQ